MVPDRAVPIKIWRPLISLIIMSIFTKHIEYFYSIGYTKIMFQRSLLKTLSDRVQENRSFIQILQGPRQVGKTTLVSQLERKKILPTLYVTTEDSATRNLEWIETHWLRARQLAAQHGKALLIIDEIQKIENWSEIVKKLWDKDSRQKLNLQVLLLGSTPLFAGRGIRESLAGRFEVVYAPHWSYKEMRECFAYTLEEYLYFGGYPGSAPLRKEPIRWRRYVRDSIIEATVSRDLLASHEIKKPALLRNLFFLCSEYSGQILSYTKMLGQLQDAGNSTTLAHYLQLLSQSGMVEGLQKKSPQKLRTRNSSPKLLALDPSLITAVNEKAFPEWKKDPELYGRLVENIVGVHLSLNARCNGGQLTYWSDGNLELDFVYEFEGKMLAIVVKSGKRRRSVPGLSVFKNHFPNAVPLIVGTGGVPLDEFLESELTAWL